MNLELLKRPAVFGTVGAVVVLLIVWWFAWMSPEQAKLTSVNQQNQTLQAQIGTLTGEVSTLEAEAQEVKAQLPYLAHFKTAIPSIPQSGQLTQELFQLSLKTKTFISSLDDDSPPQSSGKGYSSIPVSLSVSGSHNSVYAFLQGIYSLPRLVTIQSVSLSAPSGATNLMQPNTVKGFTASISATAYTTYVTPTTTAP